MSVGASDAEAFAARSFQAGGRKHDPSFGITHEDIFKSFRKLVLRSDGTNNHPEWFKDLTMYFELAFSDKEMYNAVLKRQQWTDPAWQAIRPGVGLVANEHQAKQLDWRDTKDAKIKSDNTRMLNTLLLLVERDVVQKAESRHAAEFKRAKDEKRPDLMMICLEKTVLLPHVDELNNQLAAQTKFHALKHRNREPSLWNKLYADTMEIYMRTMTDANKVLFKADTLEVTRYVATLGPEFHDFLKEIKKAEHAAKGIEAIMELALEWYRIDCDARKVSGLRAVGRTAERSVAYAAEGKFDPKSGKVYENRKPSQFGRGKLNNGDRG